MRGVQRIAEEKSPKSAVPATKNSEPVRVAKKRTGMTELSRTACFLQMS